MYRERRSIEEENIVGVCKALVIGISDYIKLQTLRFCKNDGKEVYELLKSLDYEISDNHNLVGHVEYNSMRKAINNFFTDENNKADDTLVFYYSGHGIPDVDGDVYLAASDIDPDKPFDNGYSFVDLMKMMNRSPSIRIVTILDCCYSGAAKLGKGIGKGGEEDAARLGIDALEKKANILQRGEGKYLLAASQAAQEAYALQEDNHSIFTYYLLEGLKPNVKSVDSEGNVTPFLLGNYIYRAILNLPPDKRPKQQKPIIKAEASGDIILASYPDLAKFGSNDNPMSILMEQGNNYFAKGNYDESMKCYDKVIEIDEGNLMAWNNKGRSLSELEMYDEAMKCYDNAMELNPNNVVTLRNKAALYKKKISLWKLIPIFFGFFIAFSLGVSFAIPFPYSLPIILSGYIFLPYLVHRYLTRNYRKLLKKAKQLELKNSVD